MADKRKHNDLPSIPEWSCKSSSFVATAAMHELSDLSEKCSCIFALARTQRAEAINEPGECTKIEAIIIIMVSRLLVLQLLLSRQKKFTNRTNERTNVTGDEIRFRGTRRPRALEAITFQV